MASEPLQDSQMDSVEKTTNGSEQKSRKFLKSLIRKQPQELLLVIGTGVSAAVAPGIPALCSWRSCIEAVIEAAEQLEVLHPGDVAEFRRKVTKDGDLLVVAHDLIRKMSPVLQWARGHIKYGVLHIHGLYTDPCGMVLDPSGYKDVTQDPEVMEVLQNLYRTKSFLFVGCGETLRDQIFQALFLYSVPSRVGLEHYMVVLKENEDRFFRHQADMLLHGIKVVSFGDRFDCFPGYVRDLASQICKQPSPDADRVDSTTLFGNACQDCAKRKLEENGIEVAKKLRQSATRHNVFKRTHSLRRTAPPLPSRPDHLLALDCRPRVGPEPPSLLFWVSAQGCLLRTAPTSAGAASSLWAGVWGSSFVIPPWNSAVLSGQVSC
ncbi:protein FAM118A isoform X4 [Kogia breviceps]|uniref:protein FAM118A isoform X4 n=1 Tax=Kogia breviceps TaxID=27615 RepID=UPI0034D1ECA6